jgi:ribosomal protein L23
MNIYPRKTEKAYSQSLKNIYVFDVPTTANKQQILEAVESQFEVKTTGIKTLIQSGKAVRASRGKRAHPGITNRKDLKKAYVTLVSGDSIKVFDEVKEAEPATKAVKKEKK